MIEKKEEKTMTLTMDPTLLDPAHCTTCGHDACYPWTSYSHDRGVVTLNYACCDAVHADYAARDSIGSYGRKFRAFHKTPAGKVSRERLKARLAWIRSQTRAS